MPYGDLVGALLAALVAGGAWLARGRVSPLWALGGAALALPLFFLFSNSAFAGTILGEGGVTGGPELLLRAGALGGLGLWLGVERRWGVFEGFGR